jgi:hypothetical protein
MTLALGYFMGSMVGLSFGCDEVMRNMGIIKEDPEMEARRKHIRQHCYLKENIS